MQIKFFSWYLHAHVTLMSLTDATDINFMQLKFHNCICMTFIF